MESPPKNAADVGFFVGSFATITEPQAVLMPVTFAFVIRLYLSFTSYCISGEVGFIFLMTGAVCLFLTTLRNGRIGIALGAMAVGGLAYLYRKEGIGLLILCAAFLPAVRVDMESTPAGQSVRRRRGSPLRLSNDSRTVMLH